MRGLHYLEDWGPALAELRRVLKPGGRLIVSVDHPFAIALMHREAGLKPDYFATYNYVDEWTVGGQTALLRFWTRPLHAMTDGFTAAGFRITVISEPVVAPDTPRELLPDDFADRRRFVCFLLLRPARQLIAREAAQGRKRSLDRSGGDTRGCRTATVPGVAAPGGGMRMRDGAAGDGSL